MSVWHHKNISCTHHTQQQLARSVGGRGSWWWCGGGLRSVFSADNTQNGKKNMIRPQCDSSLMMPNEQLKGNISWKQPSWTSSSGAFTQWAQLSPDPHSLTWTGRTAPRTGPPLCLFVPVMLVFTGPNMKSPRSEWTTGAVCAAEAEIHLLKWSQSESDPTCRPKHLTWEAETSQLLQPIRVELTECVSKCDIWHLQVLI